MVGHIVLPNIKLTESIGTVSIYSQFSQTKRGSIGDLPYTVLGLTSWQPSRIFYAVIKKNGTDKFAEGAKCMHSIYRFNLRIRRKLDCLFSLYDQPFLWCGIYEQCVNVCTRACAGLGLLVNRQPKVAQQYFIIPY